MKYLIHGNARAWSNVEVRADDGAVLATTTADGDGDWSIDGVSVSGEHVVRAIAIDGNGRREVSPSIVLAGDEAAGADELEDESDVEAPLVVGEQLAEVEAHYTAMVEARAAGYEVDQFHRDNLLALLDRSREQYHEDVLAHIRVNAELVELGVDPRQFDTFHFA